MRLRVGTDLPDWGFKEELLRITLHLGNIKERVRAMLNREGLWVKGKGT